MRSVSVFLGAAVVLLLMSAAAKSVRDAMPDTSNDVVDARVQALMDAGHFPGVALAVMRDGQPVYVKSYGKADLSHNIPVTSTTVFEIASLTKQMTTLAVLTLVEEGKLALTDRLASFVDDSPEAWNDITVNQLMSNMSGLPHRFEQTVNGSLLLEYSRDDMLRMAKAAPMVAVPGTDWHYSDTGYFLLGVIVEAVTDTPFAEFMQTRFFEPLGMTQTHFLDQARIVPELAQGYRWQDGELQRNRRVWQFELTPHFGVMSSLVDMMRWEAELNDPSVFNAAAIEATGEIQRTFSTGKSCDTWGYARGWQAYVRDGQRTLSHGGYSGTAYVRALGPGVSVLALTNREDGQDLVSPLAIAWAAANAIEAGLPEGGFRCWE